MSRPIGTNIVDKIVPFDTEDTYPTHEDLLGKGGYVVSESATLDSLRAGISIPQDRRKVGQIVYLPSINRHYTFSTLNDPPTGFYDLKPALPYEYSGSVFSTNFVAKTSSFNYRNIIREYLGLPNYAGLIHQDEAYEHSSILAGSNNLITRDIGFYGFKNQNTTIAGGSANVANFASFGFIGGGLRNSIINNHNAIVGGMENSAISFGNFIGSGNKNTIGFLGGYSSIVGGELNKIAQGSAIAGWSFVGGGRSNSVAGEFSAIVAGSNNLVSGRYNFVGGGIQNSAAGGGDVIVGGSNNSTASTNIPELTLLNVSYNDLNISSQFVKDTKVRYINAANSIYEFIPGARVNDLDAAGVLRVLPYSDTVDSFRTARVPALSVISPNVTLNGRFGHTFYRTSLTRSGSSHYIITEPGSNKVHIFRVNDLNRNQQPTLITTINPPITIPADSEFGFSINYIDDRGHLGGINKNGDALIEAPKAYNLLTIGSPGNSRAYVYSHNSSLFNFGASTPSSSIFSYIEELTGQNGSQFGYQIAGTSTFANDGTLTNHPSALFLAIGAPNHNRGVLAPNDVTGAIYVYVTQPALSYTNSNKTYRPFYNSVIIDKRDSRYQASQPEFGTVQIYNGDRVGESITITTIDTLTPTGTYNKELSSVLFRLYTSVPNARLTRAYTIGDELPNQIFQKTGQPFNFSRLPTNWTINPPYSGATIDTLSGAGIQYGFQVYSQFNAAQYNESPWNATWYGDFTLTMQGGTENYGFIFEGPGRNVSGIYSLQSVLSATGDVYSFVGPPSYTINNEYYSWTGPVQEWEYKLLCDTPNTINTATGLPYPGILYTRISDARGNVNYMAPYPLDVPIQDIRLYGFQNFRLKATAERGSLSTIYYLRNGVLSYSNFAADIPGEGTSTNTILGGENNIASGRTSIIGAGSNNNIGTNVVRSAIIGGGSNLISTAVGSFTNRSYNLIGTGLNNTIKDSDFSNILNGTGNTIQDRCIHAGILGGTQNTILSGLSGVFVLGNSLSGEKSFTTYVNNLFASDHIQAKTKSFTISHPTKKGKTLTYGSLESPYHGIRLTGNDKVVNGECVVVLPEYINKLVSTENINIQLTNYQHSKILYVDNIDLSNNSFTVKVDCLFKRQNEYKFFWSFTAIRKDVPELVTEA